MGEAKRCRAAGRVDRPAPAPEAPMSPTASAMLAELRALMAAIPPKPFNGADRLIFSPEDALKVDVLTMSPAILIDVSDLVPTGVVIGMRGREVVWRSWFGGEA